ncbi:dolichol kinase [Diaphorina citri]|uniref:dolichol kinase n=1 Tax=Diaphorina citri TaxID=121845 RepID=A0A3Q0JE44_DIACI|nr:dolichol kinase [Diaphorina citri]
MGYGVYINILHSLVSALCYHPLLEQLMKSVKDGFTYGEASIVTQTFLLFQMHVYTNAFLSKQGLVNCQDIATLVLQVGLSCIVLHGSLVYIVPSLRILWIIQLLLADTHTVLLVIYWVACVLIAIAVIAFQISSNQKATTSLRKYFHLLAVAVYIPGLVFNRCLLYLASGVVLALFLVLEIMRILCLPPLSDVLNQGFHMYVDEKDSTVALTPLYLLTGCSLPLWLSPGPLDQADMLSLSAGILSIGVGDCFASMVGFKYGKHKWKNSPKSIEGSAACFLSQLLVILAFFYLDLIPWNKVYIGVVGTGIVTLIEAKTDQVDNLVLPLVQYCIFLLG